MHSNAIAGCPPLILLPLPHLSCLPPPSSLLPRWSQLHRPPLPPPPLPHLPLRPVESSLPHHADSSHPLPATPPNLTFSWPAPRRPIHHGCSSPAVATHCRATAAWPPSTTGGHSEPARKRRRHCSPPGAPLAGTVQRAIAFERYSFFLAFPFAMWNICTHDMIALGNTHCHQHARDHTCWLQVVAQLTDST